MKSSTVSDQRLVETSHIVTYGFYLLPFGVDVNACLYALSHMVSDVLRRPSEQPSLYRKYLVDYQTLAAAFIGKDGKLVSDIVAEWMAENTLFAVKRDQYFDRIKDVFSYELRSHFILMSNRYSSSEGKVLN